jgi:hypothetical protein
MQRGKEEGTNVRSGIRLDTYAFGVEKQWARSLFFLEVHLQTCEYNKILSFSCPLLFSPVQAKCERSLPAER